MRVYSTVASVQLTLSQSAGAGGFYNAVPATAEVQMGKMFSPSFGAYADGLLGIGGDRPYEWGVGLGVRFNY